MSERPRRQPRETGTSERNAARLDHEEIAPTRTPSQPSPQAWRLTFCPETRTSLGVPHPTAVPTPLGVPHPTAVPTPPGVPRPTAVPTSSRPGTTRAVHAVGRPPGCCTQDCPDSTDGRTIAAPAQMPAE